MSSPFIPPDQPFRSESPTQNLTALSIAALGVVFGDIATSPLYAISQVFFGHATIATDQTNVLGVISVVVWVLTLLIGIKYLTFVLRASNDGQGGVFALYALLDKHKNRGQRYLLFLLMIAAGMLFGDGIITPAISVLAAVEGLKVFAPALAGDIIPITVAILTLLFLVQRHGTHRVGGVFGPIVALWLFSISILGIRYIIQFPEIILAFNPLYGMRFLSQMHSHDLLLILASVMLVITGGEALYADLGHFGIRPIRLSWITIVYPCLILNYLGQGAFLLSHEPVREGNVFFSMVPPSILSPMIILATAATIIASQALITGAFSLTVQAMGLGLFPRVHTVHTHEEHEGQIYIRFINWALYTGCITLVLTFQSSTNLASAYGLAVSYDMTITSLAMMAVARFYWGWNPMLAYAGFGLILIADSTFFIANSTKFLQGGFVPVGVGVLMFLIMTTWRWGRRATFNAYKNLTTMTMEELIEIKNAPYARSIDRTVIMMCATLVNSPNDEVPLLVNHYLERYAQLPRDLILLTVIERKVPYIHDDRYQIRLFQKSADHGSIAAVAVNFGFMEMPNVEAILDELARHHELALQKDHVTWYVHASKERLVPANNLGWWKRHRLKLFIFLRQNSIPAYYFFGLGTDTNLSIEVFPVKIS